MIWACCWIFVYIFGTTKDIWIKFHIIKAKISLINSGKVQNSSFTVEDIVIVQIRSLERTTFCKPSYRIFLLRSLIYRVIGHFWEVLGSWNPQETFGKLLSNSWAKYYSNVLHSSNVFEEIWNWNFFNFRLFVSHLGLNDWRDSYKICYTYS